ncbi:terminase gpA endonuclease subunit [Planctomicrobium sp. SH661]|uniref:terminase gpA endonuclease subunit n=1 Tax=Planctomicrobium sp. SH661 TaxID=3448124 RepID=UPI003F5C161C
MISCLFSSKVYDCVLPRPQIATKDWVCQWLKMPSDSKMKGSYRLDLFPHFIEPFDAFDDPEIDRITIQTAAQIGKTAFSQAALAKTAACNPHPMAFADANERSTKRVIRRTWRLFERCETLAPICPPPRMRSQDHMNLTTCEIHGAWAGSPSSAADYGAFIVVLNECDKMKQKSTDSEADFRWLMGERTKGYVGAKVLIISTPALKGTSYVEQQRLAGDNRRRMVPCPFCNHFQELFMGDGKKPGGVRFQKLNGKLDPDKARETAYIQCEKCEKKIEEQHRYQMLNAGKWVKEGQEIDSKGRITGAPTRAGRHASFGPLSTLHSLLPGVTIGVYAEEFVKAITAAEGKKEAIRNFINSWEGKTFDPRPVTVQPSDIALRMGVDEPLRVCPAWSRFLTFGSDVGRVGDELIFYWWVSAWGNGGRGQLVDLGFALSKTQLLEVRRSAAYPHADNGPPLQLSATGIDSGSYTNEVYELTAQLPGCWPIKGSSKDADRPFVDVDFPEMYRAGFQRSGLTALEVKAKQRAAQYDLLIANTQRSQEWVEERLTGLVKREDPNWYSIPREAIEGQVIPGVDLARHLLGDVQDEHGRWKKRYEGQDLRDAFRYSMIMAWFHTANGTNWNRLAPRAHTIVKPVVSRDEPKGFIRKMSGSRLGGR